MFVDPTPRQTSPEWEAYVERQRSLWGFVPDYVGCFAARPEVARAWSSLAATVMGSMDRRRYELASITAARTRRSTYCTVAHSVFLRDVCHDPDTMRRLALDPTGSTLPALDAAVVRFAATLASDPAEVEEGHLAALRDHGLSDADIADIVYAVALRTFFTTVLDGLGARLDAATAASFGADLLAACTVGRPPLPA